MTRNGPFRTGRELIFVYLKYFGNAKKLSWLLRRREPLMTNNTEMATGSLVLRCFVKLPVPFCSEDQIDVNPLMNPV